MQRWVIDLRVVSSIDWYRADDEDLGKAGPRELAFELSDCRFGFITRQLCHQHALPLVLNQRATAYGVDCHGRALDRKWINDAVFVAQLG